MNERLKLLRKELSLSQEAFGKKLGVTGAGISKIESGDRSLTEQMILSVCREFNVREEWLRTGCGEMFVPDPDDILKKLQQDYHLDDFSYNLIREYLELDEKSRDAFRQFFFSVASHSTPASNDNEMDIDAMVEDYRRQLILEKKAAEKFEVSQKNG